METVGFTDVTVKSFQIPCGAWAKDPVLKKAGVALKLWLLEALNGLANKPLGLGLGWSAEDVDILLAKVRQDLKSPRIREKQIFFNLLIVCGRKPHGDADT